MKSQSVADLAPGNRLETTFLIHSKERKTASNGRPYLDLELRDASGVIKAKVWDCDRVGQDFEPEDFVWVQGSVDTYRGAPQVVVTKIRRCRDEEIDPRDYLPRSERDAEEMYAALLARLRLVPEGPLRALLLALFEDPAIAEKYKLAPAAMSYHHAYLGGLVEHVLSLIELADQVCDHYPFLRRDLVLAGIVLHDIGKTEELAFRRGFRYTTRGQLLGHITVGLEMVNEKMRAVPDFPADLRDQLQHIILSHHGELEFGSPKEPAFPEALVVHALDNLDSKLASMRAQYATDKNREGDFTARNPALKRELLKIDPLKH
ncbi:MAG: HD domain-containing protein [Acidobacteriia bacterium]|nr:HD domain-containing protein [Terriglobia bacterium]